MYKAYECHFQWPIPKLYDPWALENLMSTNSNLKIHLPSGMKNLKPTLEYVTSWKLFGSLYSSL